MNKSLVWLGIALAVLAGCFLSLVAGALAGGMVGYLAIRRAPETAVPQPSEELVPPQGPWEEIPEPWRRVPQPWEVPPEEMVRPFAWQIGGALIAEVEPGEPADQAGVEVGDIIIAVDSRAMDESHDLAVLIRQHEPGEDVVLTILRPGDETEIMELEVTLGRDRDEEGKLVPRLGVRYRTVASGMCLMAPDRGPWD